MKPFVLSCYLNSPPDVNVFGMTISQTWTMARSRSVLKSRDVTRTTLDPYVTSLCIVNINCKSKLVMVFNADADFLDTPYGTDSENTTTDPEVFPIKSTRRTKWAKHKYFNGASYLILKWINYIFVATHPRSKYEP
jgi:hypothetical protein